MRLDQSQQLAVDLMTRERFGVVTGGPGTGKTTTLRAALARLEGQSIALAAPTGKAARRMSEATGEPAITIHRLLEWSRDGFQRCESTPIAADVVFIDESSMIDIRLFAALIGAIDFEATRLILIGDADQLPPVGPGAPFADVIRAGAVPVARLTTLHRAARDSWICRNAPIVLAGRRPQLDGCPDLSFVECDETDQVVEAAIRVMTDRPGTPILTPQNSGPAGVDLLNAEGQRVCNPSPPTSAIIGDRKIGQGDPVIQTRNNYDLGIMNGEIGAVTRAQKSPLVISAAIGAGEEPIEYQGAAAYDLRLAYALTIHKSQGSEWDWVAVVCHSTHFRMLSRQLFYTAITRAKLGVILIGNKRGIDQAIKNAAPARRNTSLAERLTA